MSQNIHEIPKLHMDQHQITILPRIGNHDDIMTIESMLIMPKANKP